MHFGFSEADSGFLGRAGHMGQKEMLVRDL